jgi:hypothetical protein
MKPASIKRRSRVPFSANYPRPGVKDRPWPDPNDEAGGDGRLLRPKVVRITGTRPRWVAWQGKWGDSDAGWIPGEQSSPRGPAYQPAWEDPSGLEQSARACAAAPPTRAWQTALTAALAALLAASGVALVWRRRNRAA